MRKIFIIMLLSLCLCSKSAYAYVDPLAFLETMLKKVQVVQTQILEYKKLLTDTITQARQGFDSATNCFSNPLSCGKAYMDATKVVKGVRSIGGELTSGDLTTKAPSSLARSVIRDGTYKKGLGKDIARRHKMKEENNATVSANVAMLFAKGMVTHQNIIQEKPDLYEAKFEQNNVDEIIYAHSKVVLNSKRRIAHILELRSYMHSPEALKELIQYNRENDEEQ